MHYIFGSGDLELDPGWLLMHGYARCQQLCSPGWINTYEGRLFPSLKRAGGGAKSSPLPISHKIIVLVIFFTEYHNLISCHKNASKRNCLGSRSRSQLKVKERKREFSLICILCYFFGGPNLKMLSYPQFSSDFHEISNVSSLWA